MRIKHKIDRFIQLNPIERVFFLKAFFFFCYYYCALKFFHSGRVIRPFLHKDKQLRKTITPPSLSPGRAAKLIKTAAWSVFTFTCLPQALAGHRLLKALGYPVTLHIGAAKDAQNHLKAHAWLTLGNEILIGELDDIDTFTELPLEQIQCYHKAGK